MCLLVGHQCPISVLVLLTLDRCRAPQHALQAETVPHPCILDRYTVRGADGAELPVVAWVTVAEERDSEGRVQAIVAVAIDQSAAQGR